MKLLNKQKRLQYIGFNDLWFVVIGMFVLGFVTDYIFANSFAKYPLKKALINWVVAFLFSIANWSIMRASFIYFRKKYPKVEQVGKRAAILFCVIVVCASSIDIIGNLIIEYLSGEPYYFTKRFRVLVSIIIICVMIMAIYEAIYFYIQLKQSIREEEQAKQVVVLAQLDALRNQAQPHFFFNSLNTLRDIIDQNSKEDAKQFVDKLSDVYRYILDAGDANVIPLRDELKFAHAYIHIQKERFGPNLKLNLQLPETVLDRLIVPMSLQLLLENAIKHNVISRSKPLTINIAIENDFLVVNNKIKPKSTKLPSTKLGLINMEKRHALISDKAPKIDDNGNDFTVYVPLLQPSDLKAKL
ncbi:MAG: histidine kinase [Bacteroidota bacterium]